MLKHQKGMVEKTGNSSRKDVLVHGRKSKV